MNALLTLLAESKYDFQKLSTGLTKTIIIHLDDDGSIVKFVFDETDRIETINTNR